MRDDVIDLAAGDSAVDQCPGSGRAKASTVASQGAPAMTEAGKLSWRDWNWNSDYWRNLAAPWGGALGPASDIARFYQEFLAQRGTILKPATERLMITNQLPAGVRPSGRRVDKELHRPRAVSFG